MLELKQISKSFGTHRAVRSVDFLLQRGEVLGFLGPNGAGKSTTMRIVAGVIEPDHGDVLIAGQSVITHRRDAQRHLGYLPEGAPLYPDMTPLEFLRYLCAARNVPRKTCQQAIDRVIAGPQRRTRLMSEHEKLITAYHEGGHALVAAALPGNDPVHKITILPRGRALGYTMVLPDSDKYSQPRSQMLDQLAYMLGGRAAEEMIFHDPTTGAGNDIEKATNLARAMVTQYGMTERLGAIKLGESGSQPFLGRDLGHSRDYSESVAAIVDEEVKNLLATAHQEAFDILEENRDVLDALVLELLDKETLDKEQIARIFEALRMRPARPAWTGSDTRRPSDMPPVEIPQEIRDRAKANGTPSAPEPDAGAVVTPPGAGGDVLDLVEHIHAVGHLSEHRIPVGGRCGAGIVEKAVVGAGVDEELGCRAVHFIGPGHRQCPVVVFQPVGRLVLDRGAHRLLLHVGRESATLDHEVLDHPVEDGAVVVAVGNILQEVFHRERRLGSVELRGDCTQAGLDDDDRVVLRERIRVVQGHGKTTRAQQN